MKNWRDRIDQTIAFIRTANIPLLHRNKRDLVADLLTRKYPITQAVSIGMSQGHNWAIRGRAGIQTTRSYRRACIAIRTSILGDALGVASAAIAAVADVNLPWRLGADIGNAYNHEVQHLQTKRQQLLNNPVHFLNNHNIYITETGNSGLVPYIFYYNHNQGNQTYCFAPVGANQNNILPLDGIHGNRAVYITFNVHHVRIQQFTAIQGNLGAIIGDLINGAASIMLTARFSGCSFMYQTAGVNMTAIHINPGGPAHGRFYELAETLRGNHVPPPVIPAPAFGNANNAGPIRVFGCRAVEAQPFDYEPNGYHFLIGIVRLGVWEVYVQKHNPINRRSARWQVS